MAARDSTQPSTPNPHATKRKLDNDSHDPSPKKRRAANAQLPNRAQNRAHNPQIQTHNQAPATSSYSQIHNPLLAKLNGKFEVKAMSVLHSTNIGKHVDRALGHLGRFSTWDESVLPGVVLLCAKSSASSKLITIAEIIRRRISESEQKWFQYNVPKETVIEEPAAAEEDPSVVEDTFMDVEKEGGSGADDVDDEYFETRQPTIHEQAVQPTKVKYKAHVAILLSRVPLDELAAEPNVSAQTNEERIEHLRKKKMGLIN